MRQRYAHDDVTPNANGTMMANLARLEALTGDRLDRLGRGDGGHELVEWIAARIELRRDYDLRPRRQRGREQPRHHQP